MNQIVLCILFLTLTACTIDAHFAGTPFSSNEPTTSETVSIDLRANGLTTEIYTSYDQTNYTLYQTIAGHMKNSSFTDYDHKEISKDDGFVVIEKTASSPASWANQTLWYVGSVTQNFEHYMDLTVDISDCDLYNHADFLTMYCWNGNNTSSLMYQVDKQTKTIQNTLDKWGYVGDSTYDYNMELLWPRPDAPSETIAVYKVLKADTNVRELVDLYVYAGSDYQKIAINSSDLNAIKTTTSFGTTAQVTVGTDELVLTSSNDSNTGITNLLVINITTPTAATLSIHANADLRYIGVIGNSVIYSGNDTYYKTYSIASGLQDTTIPLGNVDTQVHDNALFVASSTLSFKKCSVDGNCSTLISDFSTSRLLSRDSSTKIYLIDSGPNEPDQVIKSVDVATGNVATETTLTTFIRAQALTMNDVQGIFQNGNYLIVQSGWRYLVLDKDATTLKADFQHYCGGNSSYPTQNHRYLVPHFKGWNLVENRFVCL